MELAILDVVVFVGFLAAVVTVGLLASRHEKDSEAYFLAGRGLNWCLIGFSLIAANISAEQFVGMSGQAAKDSVGLAIASYEWIAAVTLVAVAFFFLPKFLRSGIYTIPEYLEYRYTHTARTLMSLLMVIIYVGVNIATVIFLGAKAFQPFFVGLEIPLLGQLGIAKLSVIIGMVAAVYVAAGGLRACAWADLIQGSALILGGAVILVLVLMALDQPEKYEQIDASQVHASLGVQPEATLGQKLLVLKERKMHMALPATSDVLPWTALLLGIWIPNFYYWGLNQYIMQRSLAARSLSQGQMGVVFAAALKLIIPFVVCIPGILAFTLYAPKMQENAMTDSRLNGGVLAEFEKQRANPAEATKVFPFNDDFAELHPELAVQVFLFNAAVAGVEVAPGASLDEVCMRAVQHFAEQDPEFRKELERLKKQTEKDLDKAATPSLKQLNDEAVLLASGGRLNTAKRLLCWLRGERPRAERQQELIGYDYDGAFPLLMRYVTRKGLRGFVLAALMGAVVSTLASMLNAASTIFTMDLYREYIDPQATQRRLVWVGRLCVPVCALIGCLIAPQLANPKFKGAFSYIQEFQGYISPGVLTIFLFGLFVARTPRKAGVVGLALSPVIYGFLHLFYSDMAFLNRMAITVGSLCAVLAVMTLVAPLKERVTLPVQEEFDLRSSRGALVFGSRGALVFGLVVIAATVGLYVIFW